MPEGMSRSMEDLWNKGMREGMEKGFEKKAIDTACRMLNDGRYSFDRVVDISSLSAQKVQELKEQLTNARVG